MLPHDLPISCIVSYFIFSSPAPLTVGTGHDVSSYPVKYSGFKRSLRAAPPPRRLRRGPRRRACRSRAVFRVRDAPVLVVLRRHGAGQRQLALELRHGFLLGKPLLLQCRELFLIFYDLIQLFLRGKLVEALFQLSKNSAPVAIGRSSFNSPVTEAPGSTVRRCALAPIFFPRGNPPRRRRTLPPIHA